MRAGGFNPRAPAGRDMMRDAALARRAVSIRAPPRGATRVRALQVFGGARFQSARPRGARLDVAPSSTIPYRFNPRAPAGRDQRGVDGAPHLSAVSIRAPPRGATPITRRCAGAFGVSIRAPPRGATFDRRRLGGGGRFQSARPRGARQVHRSGRHRRAPRFNPRAPAGRDALRPPAACDVYRFQSARPRGARRVSLQFFRTWRAVSIRAPPRGATGCVL